MACYGISNIMVFGSGPFRILEYIRYWATRINPHFGSMFSCMMCFPTNLGIVLSLLDYLWIPGEITPFNMILENTNMWYFIAIMDGGLTSGMVWFIHQIATFFENVGGNGNDNDESIITEDVTLND